jgi:O-antigen/teichoic acid export membrane protein
VATAVALYLLLGLAAVLLGALLAPVFPYLIHLPPGQEGIARWLVLLTGISVGVAIPSAATYAILRGLQRFDLANLISITGTLLYASGMAAVLLTGGGVLAMMVVSIAVSAAMQLPAVLLIRRIAPDLKLHWRAIDRSQLRTVAAFSSSTFVANLAGQLRTKTDEFVIAAFMPVAAVTPYALANRLSETAQLFAQQFTKVLLPVASMLDATQAQTQLRNLYILSTRLVLAIFLPLACVLVVLAQPLLTLWVGAQYAGSTVLVLILTLARLITISQWPALAVLTGTARHRPLAIFAILSGVGNLLLSLLLVQWWGLTGVALGTLIPVSVETFCFALPYALRSIGVGWREAAARMVGPALVPVLPAMVVLIWLRGALAPASLPAVAAVAALGLLTYAVVYLAMGACAEERLLLRQAWQQLTLYATSLGRTAPSQGRGEPPSA